MGYKGYKCFNYVYAQKIFKNIPFLISFGSNLGGMVTVFVEDFYEKSRMKFDYNKLQNYRTPPRDKLHTRKDEWAGTNKKEETKAV